VGGFVGFAATPTRVSERSEGSPPKPEPPPATDTEAQLRRIAAAHNLDWAEIKKWLRPCDVEASGAYLRSSDSRDRQGLVHWLRLLSDRSIPKLPPQWLDELDRQRRPS
jgi:hypothetical protein